MALSLACHAISVVSVNCCLLVSSLHGLDLLAKTLLRSVLLTSDCEPEPVCLSLVELEVVLACS